MDSNCALHKQAQSPGKREEVAADHGCARTPPHIHPASQPASPPASRCAERAPSPTPTASHTGHTCRQQPTPVPPEIAEHVPVFATCPHRNTSMQPVQVFGCAPVGSGLKYMLGTGKPEKTYGQLAEEARVTRERLQIMHNRAKGIPNQTQKRAKLLRACNATEDNSLESLKTILSGPHSDLAKQAEIMAMFSAKLHYYESALDDALRKLSTFKQHDDGRQHALEHCEARLRDLQDEIQRNNEQQRHVSCLLSNCLKSHECENKLEDKNREIRSLQDSLFRSSIEKDKIKSQKDRVDKVLEQMASESKQGAFIHLGAIPPLFESAVARVNATTEIFTKLFMMAMKKAKRNLVTDAHNLLPGVYVSKPMHIAYVFQAYISNQMFVGFEDADFCLDDAGLEDDRKRRGDCFMHFSNMVLPLDPKEDDPFSKGKQVAFQKFCCSKFMAVVPPWLERTLFKDLRSRERIDKGEEPENELYEKLKDMAASIWLLHRLATSFKPSGAIFRVRRGADVNPNLMEVVVPKEEDGNFFDKVGFMIMPGFEAKGTTIRSRVYLDGPKQTLEQLQQLASAAGGVTGPTAAQGASAPAPAARRAGSPRKRA